MKRFVVAAAVSLAVVAGSVAFVASPAAAVCDVNKSKGATWTFAAEDCNGGFSVQARIDRYYAGVVYTHVGPQGPTSYVSASEGYNAGNAFRTNTGGSWDPWIWF